HRDRGDEVVIAPRGQDRVLSPILFKANDPPGGRAAEDRATGIVQTVVPAWLSASLTPVENGVGGEELAGVGAVGTSRPVKEVEWRFSGGRPERNHLKGSLANRAPTESGLVGMEGGNRRRAVRIGASGRGCEPLVGAVPLRGVGDFFHISAPQ